MRYLVLFNKRLVLLLELGKPYFVEMLPLENIIFYEDNTTAGDRGGGHTF